MAMKPGLPFSHVVFTCPHCPGLTFATVGEQIEHTAEEHDIDIWNAVAWRAALTEEG